MKQSATRRSQGFTLIELMTVVLVIALLVAITSGVASYIQQRVAISKAKAQMAAIEVGLEAYKSDWGYYPPTQPVHYSAQGLGEASNNWYLYRSLAGLSPSGAQVGKSYIRMTAMQVMTNTVSPASISGTKTNFTLNLYDPWGTPYNYYCSPRTEYGVSNALPNGWASYGPPYDASNYWYRGYAVGGQVNVSSYDLSSYGPDKSTFVTGAVAYSGGFNYAWYFGVAGNRWTNRAASLDDITNFGK